MSSTPDPSITGLLAAWAAGDAAALSRLVPLVYGDLHHIARRHMRGEVAGHTLQATALVHEAYFQLRRQRPSGWHNRAQFFAVAARLMRRVLLRHVERRRASKRGGGRPMVSFDEGFDWGPREVQELQRLNDSLEVLAAFDSRQAQIVELRFFVGLTVEEAARALEISPRTVKREWRVARAWLQREILAGSEPGLTTGSVGRAP